MPLKTIFRVERKDGLGPFHANFYQKLWFYDEPLSKEWRQSQLKFPGFKTDFTGVTNDYISGVEMRSQLDTWFKPFFAYLKQEGYVIAEYQCDDFILGNSGTQIAFNKSKAKLVTRHDIDAKLPERKKV
jgi:hypothetical protein